VLRKEERDISDLDWGSTRERSKTKGEGVAKKVRSKRRIYLQLVHRRSLRRGKRGKKTGYAMAGKKRRELIFINGNATNLGTRGGQSGS